MRGSNVLRLLLAPYWWAARVRWQLCDRLEQRLLGGGHQSDGSGWCERCRLRDPR